MSKTEKRTAEVIEQAVTGEELDSDKEPEAKETLSIFEAPRSNFGLLHYSVSLHVQRLVREAGSCGLRCRL